MRSDDTGCGMFRLEWPSQYLRSEFPSLSNQIVSVSPKNRGMLIQAGLDKNNNVAQAMFPDNMAVIVIQRTTHRHLMECIPFWQESGIRVVIDVDDDMSCIHPSNPAFKAYQPSKDNMHSHAHLTRACQMADAVTVTTPALARRYRPDAYVIPNYLPDQYYGISRIDNTDLMWPASIGTHPNDHIPIGNALQRVVRETDSQVHMIGSDTAIATYKRSLGVDPVHYPYVSMDEWPEFLATVGVAFVPLADTKFNESKSWLKLLELSACGVPWVASPRADYVRFSKVTGYGMFADRPNEWRRNLKQLINDAGFREHRSQQGRIAADVLRLRDHVRSWLDPWGLVVSSNPTQPITVSG